jgi:hypothetical protein
MRSLVTVLWLWPWILACGSSPAPTGGAADLPESTRPAPASQPWRVPEGFRGETIPFPLDFAPGLAHQGVEELRFAPGFFDPEAPGYWAYTFVWRTSDPAELDAAALAAELTTYFRGLIDAVDQAKAITDRAAIVAQAESVGPRFAVTAHVFDAFKTKQPLDLVGWAERRACRVGAVWRFVLAPADTSLRPQLEALAAEAVCDQPVPPPPATPPPATPPPAPPPPPPAR